MSVGICGICIYMYVCVPLMINGTSKESRVVVKRSNDVNGTFFYLIFTDQVFPWYICIRRCVYISYFYLIGINLIQLTFDVFSGIYQRKFTNFVITYEMWGGGLCLCFFLCLRLFPFLCISLCISVLCL